MSRPFDAVRDVTDAKELWKFAVRLEDLWKMGSGKSEHLQFIILDKHGDNIQVVLPNELLPIWKSRLQEGSTYVMKNFKVKKNDLKVKFCDHPWMLTMVDGVGASDIVPKQMTDIPQYKFNFKSFDDIKNGKFREDLLVDIIGVVHEVAPPKVSNGPKKAPTNFTLIDADMNIVTCTLWDKFGSEFMANYNESGGVGPIGVILKHAKIKEPQGQYDLTISNAWIGTKLIMDQEFAEIKDFILHLPTDFESQTQSQLEDGGSKFTGQSSQGSQYTVGGRYCYRTPATHLSKFPLLPEELIVTTVGTPRKIIVFKWGWFYHACKDCNKQIVTDSAPWKCKENHVTENPQIRYKLELEVSYGSHTYNLLFWDHECTQMIGKTAAELADIMRSEGEFDRHEYPVHLDKIMGTELAFKVKKSGNKNVGVLNYKEDPEIIAHLKGELDSEKNVEHFPRPHIARAVDGITRIRIKYEDTRFHHPAYIMTSGRKYKERYIGRAWYVYVSYHKPRPGDTIRFTLHNPPNSLYVKLFRKPVRSRGNRQQ